jgi:23S rRNA (guanosine2251-2'-O)-methyltransferase
VSDRSRVHITIYGRRAVLEALHEPNVEVDAIAVDSGTPGSFRTELADAAARHDVTVEKASRDRVTSLSGDRRNDQGVVARIRLRGVMDDESFTAALTGTSARTPTRVLALDNVTNPQNVGMIVRSAVAGGMQGMLWPEVGTPWVSGLIIKASASTIYRCPIVRCHALLDGLWTFKQRGFTLIGLEAGGSESVLTHEPPHRAVYIVGGETHGISDEVLDVLDARVHIPMANDVESLNAAVAASLVCFRAGSVGA